VVLYSVLYSEEEGREVDLDPSRAAEIHPEIAAPTSERMGEAPVCVMRHLMQAVKLH